MADTLSTLEQKRAAIRTQYERSLSDAYAGGPAGRERVWARLLPLIDDYADAKAATQQSDENSTPSPDDKPAPDTAKHEDSSPILMSDGAQEPTTGKEPPGTPQPPRAKPNARKATS